MMNKVTLKQSYRARNRWLTTAQIAFSYENMQAASVVYAMGPVLEQLYQDDPEGLKNSLKTHLRFFNTQPYMGSLILSSALAVEESGGAEAASSIRTSLMGPFAGLGDSIFFVLPKTIFGAIAAYMAIDGNVMGLFIAMAIGLTMLAARIKMWDIGFKQGVKFITGNQVMLSKLTEAVSVLGLVVVGALIATNVKLSTTLSFTVGESVTVLQDVLDRILPNLLPLLVTVAVYTILGNKKMTSSKMVWIIIILAVILSMAHVF